MPTERVLGLVGSLRAASHNGFLLRAAAEAAPAGLTILPFGLAAIPVFNADVLASGEPASVAELRAAVRDSAALLIASPEYNYGIPGVLKNAIDWISRPPGRSPLERKPAAIMGASAGRSGTMRMQMELRVVLQSVEMYVMPKPEVIVPYSRDAFDDDGRLTDAVTRHRLVEFMAAFAGWIRRFPAEGR